MPVDFREDPQLGTVFSERRNHSQGYSHISMLDRMYSGKTLVKVLIRKLRRRTLGVPHAIEPAATFGLTVFAHPDLDGGGSGFGQDYLRVLREIGLRECDRLFELSAGPGFIGYSLLARGFCRHLVLADINSVAVQAARQSAEFNRIEHRVTIYESDGLKQIPPTEKWDVVVGNPPHFAQWNGRLKLLFEDPAWSLHRSFYSSVRHYLTPGAHVILQENALGSSPDIFEPMILEGGGEVVGTTPGPDLGRGGKMYYLLSRWNS